MVAVPPLPERPDDLERLLWVLRNGEGFGLYFACCNVPAYRRGLVETIKAEYSGVILELDLADGPEGLPAETEHVSLDERLALWLADKTPGAPLFLYGLETWLPSKDTERQYRTLQELNWRRNAFRKLERNLVIWLPEYALNLVIRQATDFYEWRSGSFRFMPH